MTDFEVLKELVRRGLKLRRAGRTDEESFSCYILNVGQGDAGKAVSIRAEDWDTPWAARAMRLLLDATNGKDE